MQGAGRPERKGIGDRITLPVQYDVTDGRLDLQAVGDDIEQPSGEGGSQSMAGRSLTAERFPDPRMLRR